MIQRVQSIWLLLAALTLICMLFLPLLTKNVNDTTYSIYTTGLYEQIKGSSGSGYKVDMSIVLIALNIASALFCFGSIFFFRNRSLQKKVITVAILVIVSVCVLCGVIVQQLPGGIAEVKVGIGTFLPVVSIVFCLLSINGIRKDEQLLRSADRLR